MSGVTESNQNLGAISGEGARQKTPVIAKQALIPFILVALLFPLWGFANDITNPLVKAFKDIFLISNAQSSMVQFAFYLGYGIMALPAAIFIRKYSYKSGILLGLALYAVGAILFLPASMLGEFNYFLIALCVLTCGLALLETTANPYILSMGSPETATQRLNLAQAFNPIGSLTGMWVASTYILNQLQVEEFRQAERAAHPEYAQMLPSKVDGELTKALVELSQNQPVAHSAMQAADLNTVMWPYITIACVVIGLFVLFALVKLPNTINHASPLTLQELKNTLGRLLSNDSYREGVIAQALYVGAQIMCWTFIIHYGVISVGLTAGEAQQYNMIAMFIFLASRFICTFLLGFIRPGHLLMLLSAGGIMSLSGAIYLGGMLGLYCLIATSACMSLMFPTIYGIALNKLGDDASIGSAGLVMAIVGGALMPPLQGTIIDGEAWISSIPSVQMSFILPLLCFIGIAIYGYRTNSRHGI
ncbi:L-fucose:H+ symporter permease [Paraglaciecola sp.]|uniref:L-fucose:H+ symporter permease n=1 Tax=Paraglaciecola sp. TaxID=1920173 RepID=UPI003EF80FB7